MSQSLRIDANGPLDTAAILSTLVNHEIAGLTETDSGEMTHRRVVHVDGRPRSLTIGFDPFGVTVEEEGAGRPSPGVDELVKYWFDLNTDIESVDRHLGAHEEFDAQVRSRPGIRVTRYPDLYEAVILIVLGQQISLAAARTFAGRLVEAYGQEAGDLRLFPDPGSLAAIDVDELRAAVGLTGARARTISQVAGIFAGTGRAAGPDGGHGRLDQLKAVPGIGPWTLSCISLRGFDSADELPATDAVLRRALGGITAGRAAEMAERWRPYRSYATVRLWASAAAIPA